MLAFRKFRHRTSRASRHGLVRRCVVATSLLAYVIVAAGVPLPTFKSAGKSGELYPCMGCHCGCSSAEQCWRSCCCHTLAERLAWADEHDVTPPDYALAEARESGLDDAGRPLGQKVVRVALAGKKPASTRSCCQKKASCCSDSSNQRTCCTSKSKECNDCEQPVNFILGYRALSCHGQSLNWLAAVPTLITIELNLSDEFPLVAWLGPHSSDFASPFLEGPTPPPPEQV
jgi:hypothetical protein